ncbi:MAG: PPOX class F420-dependent oxidoreductase [Acidimicrobiales bacterium]
MATVMTDDERRTFLLEGTRTGKVAWISPQGNVHVAPVWFVLDGDDVLFTTDEDSAKGKALTDGCRLSMVVDDQAPPFSYVKVDGTVSLSDDLDELVAVATRIGGRYMGEDRAEEFGRRNGVAGELVVRLSPTKLTALAAFSD